MMNVPGLSYVPEWLTADECAEVLARVDEHEWERTLRRRVQHYGHRYDYGRRTVSPIPAPAMPEWADGVRKRLIGDGRFAVEPDQLIVNEYQPGQGISSHVDCVPCFGPVIATISLGSACHMEFVEPNEDRRVAVPLAVGSLLLITGDARYVWRHAIAARRGDPGPQGRVMRSRRVSLTFRTVIPPRG